MKIIEAKNLAISLMDKHITTNRSLWKFDWQNGLRRLGRCHWNGSKLYGISGGGTIYLTIDYVVHASIEEVTKTMLHEIAHTIAGPQAGHNYHWRSICRSIGGDGQRLANVEANEGTKVLLEMAKVWEGTCGRPDCDFTIHRTRLTARSKGGYCPRCFNKAQRENNLMSAKIVWRKKR